MSGLRFPAFACLLLLATTTVVAQDDTIAWEVITDATQGEGLFVAGDSALFVSHGGIFGINVARLDEKPPVVRPLNARFSREQITMTSTGRLFAYRIGNLIYSDDYGQNWDFVQRGRTDAFLELPSGTLVAGIEERGVLRSTDGGASWTPHGLDQPLFDGHFERDFAFRPPTPNLPLGRLASVGRGGFLYSDDEGQTWQTEAFGSPFSFLGESIVYSAFHDAFFALLNGPAPDGGLTTGNVWQSADGAAWTFAGRYPTQNQTPGRLAVGPDGSLWAVSSGRVDDVVYRSVDAGATWTAALVVDGTALVGNPLRMNDVAVTPDGHVWASFTQGEGGPGLKGAVLRTAEPVAVAGDSEEVPGKPDEAVELGASYPNPTSDQITVPLVLREAADVRLVVVDLLGREVKVLAEGTRAAGTHTLAFETGGLPAGVYVVRAVIDGAATTQRVTVVR